MDHRNIRYYALSAIGLACFLCIAALIWPSTGKWAIQMAMTLLFAGMIGVATALSVRTLEDRVNALERRDRPAVADPRAAPDVQAGRAPPGADHNRSG